MEYRPKTEYELEMLAQDWMKGRLFTSAALHDQPRLIKSVFLPIAFAGPRTQQELHDAGIEFFYEYLDTAGPRRVHGFPQFSTVNLLTNSDLGRLIRKAQEIASYFSSRVPADDEPKPAVVVIDLPQELSQTPQAEPIFTGGLINDGDDVFRFSGDWNTGNGGGSSGTA